MNFDELQQVKDVYYDVLVHLDAKELISQCEINTQAARTCVRADFWLYYINHLDHLTLQQVFLDLAYHNRLEYLKLLVNAVNTAGRIIDVRTQHIAYMYTAENQHEDMATFIREIPREFDIHTFDKNIVPMFKEVEGLLHEIKAGRPIDEVDDYFNNMMRFYDAEFMGDLIINTLEIKDYEYIIFNEYGGLVCGVIIERIARNNNYDLIIRLLEYHRNIDEGMGYADSMINLKAAILNNSNMELIDKIPLRYYIYNHGKFDYHIPPYDNQVYLLYFKFEPYIVGVENGYKYYRLSPEKWIDLAVQFGTPKYTYSDIIESIISNGYTYFYKHAIKLLLDKKIFNEKDVNDLYTQIRKR